MNASRLKVNVGNLHFRKKDFSKALKYYRMALDQVPKVSVAIDGGGAGCIIGGDCVV